MYSLLFRLYEKELSIMNKLDSIQKENRRLSDRIRILKINKMRRQINRLICGTVQKRC